GPRLDPVVGEPGKLLANLVPARDLAGGNESVADRSHGRCHDMEGQKSSPCAVVLAGSGVGAREARRRNQQVHAGSSLKGPVRRRGGRPREEATPPGLGLPGLRLRPPVAAPVPAPTGTAATAENTGADAEGSDRKAASCPRRSFDIPSGRPAPSP